VNVMAGSGMTALSIGKGISLSPVAARRLRA